MASFTLDGITYEYLRQDPGPHENIKSWEYGAYPKIMATLPLADGATLDVYAHASRWNPSHILVAWQDDEYRPHWAWSQPEMSAASPTRSGTSISTGDAPNTSAASAGGTGSPASSQPGQSRHRSLG
jgi:hypothetical protein